LAKQTLCDFAALREIRGKVAVHVGRSTREFQFLGALDAQTRGAQFLKKHLQDKDVVKEKCAEE